ncbi:MAG: hypothetical protein QCI82_11680 [Candidatus Thermoplasmatota archaeon]|nr:hypothetical protein [Candidatus Thermoplasmatota archaeon]
MEEGNSMDPSEISSLKERISRLEKDITLLANEARASEANPYLEVRGDFFQVMSALRALYLDQEEDMEEIKRISQDIEEGNVKVDMTELFFRFFIRQEIQNARLKLLLLSQKFKVKGELFDELDDLQTLIDDPRFSVHQVVIGWKRFERSVAEEIKRLSGPKRTSA